MAKITGSIQTYDQASTNAYSFPKGKKRSRAGKRRRANRRKPRRKRA